MESRRKKKLAISLKVRYVNDVHLHCSSDLLRKLGCRLGG